MFRHGAKCTMTELTMVLNRIPGFGLTGKV